MLKITGCDSSTDCACLQIQPMISPWNLNLYKLDFLKSDIPIAWQCSTSKTRPAFPRRHALICQTALSSFDAFSQATIHHASHCGNSCWSQQSLLKRLVAPFHFCFIHLFCYLQLIPIAGPEHLGTAPKLSPLLPNDGASMLYPHTWKSPAPIHQAHCTSLGEFKRFPSL